jgi:hypothetical protein
MTYTAKDYHVFIDKQTKRIVGKTIDVPTSMEDRFVEIELPEPMKRLVDKIERMKQKVNN